MTLCFSKMHGLGNDFVLIDRRVDVLALSAAQIAALADRRTGIGLDQLLTIERSTRADCVANYDIFNADGSHAQQCGNGVRCIVAWLARDGALPAGAFGLNGPAGVVACERLADGQIRVDMGVPCFSPKDVPFVAISDELVHSVSVGDQRVELGVVSMGNPHSVIVVDDIGAAPVLSLGAALEVHPRFPDRVNVGFAQIHDPHAISLRVFERGVGETRACGSGACAAAAVLIRRGQAASPVTVALPGGPLQVDWAGGDQPLHMTGPAAFVFEGTCDP